MSKPNDNPTPITIAGQAEEVTEKTVAEKKPNVIVRGYRKCRRNPKNTLAVIGGVALVAAGAVIGRSTAPSSDDASVDLDAPDEMFEGEFVAELDTDVN